MRSANAFGESTLKPLVKSDVSYISSVTDCNNRRAISITRQAKGQKGCLQKPTCNKSFAAFLEGSKNLSYQKGPDMYLGSIRILAIIRVQSLDDGVLWVEF